MGSARVGAAHTYCTGTVRALLLRQNARAENTARLGASNGLPIAPLAA